MATTHPFPKKEFVHLADVAARPGFLTKWERRRHTQAHWFVELAAEFIGVFIYVFAGVGSTAAYVLGNLAGESLSSIFQIGVAYSLGIVLALVICSSTSGGHFNPAVTLAFVLFKKFPPLKALRYIVAQILGGYVACLLIYVQYQHLITEVEQALTAKGALDAINFTPQGPAGIFALYVLPGSNLKQVLLNEFMCDVFIGLTIWSCLDPTNFMASPVSAPWIIAFSYGISIWGYSPIGLAANAARDVAGRLAVLTIWGLKAGGGSYAALAALTNIPATLFGIMIYEFILHDSSRVITPGHVDFLAGHQAHAEHRENHEMNKRSAGSPYSPTDSEYAKGTIEALEKA
ncbi:aquaporin-like protein [Abortiporus biennis]|nr:aquaporin-like protein [Abortiporus biennis]